MRYRLSKAVVGLDLSNISDKLVQWLPYLKTMGTNHLVLVHIIPIDKVERATGYPVDKLIKEYEEEASKELSKYAHYLRGKGFTVDIASIDVADPAAGIVEKAEEYNADYIVVGERGGGLRRILLGHVSEAVVELSDKPVLIVKGLVVWREESRPELASASSPFSGPLIVGIDFDETLESVMGYAELIAMKTGVKIVLVHVIEESKEDKETIASRIEGIVLSLEKKGLKTEYILYDRGSPGKLIVREAERLKAGMIVIGYAKPGSLFRGSTSDIVIRKSKQHVLVIK
jgi:nucleotide-binding universal stress UspA family protein